MPDFELFVKYHEKEKITLADFRGKWLILDFWTSTCVPCITSFPKMNELHMKFKDSVKIIMIGDNSTKYYKNIEEVYEKIRAKKDLALAVSFDSTTFKAWNIRSVPTIFIVDPQGYLQVITNSIDEARLQLLFKQRKANFTTKSRSMVFNADGELVVKSDNVIKKTDHSILLKKEINHLQYIMPHFDSVYKDKAVFFASGISLANLYNLAYLGYNVTAFHFPGNKDYGKFYPFPVLNIKEKEPFSAKYEAPAGDQTIQEGVYNYSLRLPKKNATKADMMGAMQQDLKLWFGYQVQLKELMMPYYKLVKIKNDSQLLKSSNSTKETKTFGDEGFEAYNVTMNSIISRIFNYNQDGPPIINETGIDYNVDIKLDVNLRDIDEVKLALRRVGLDLKKSKKLMKVVVISDSLVLHRPSID